MNQSNNSSEELVFESNTIPVQFRGAKCKKYKIPESTPDKIIFMYDYVKKLYVLTDFEEEIEYLRILLNDFNVGFRHVNKFLKRTMMARDKKTKDQKFLEINYNDESYSQSMKILWIVIFLFLGFFIIAIYKTYYRPDQNVEFIAIPFCILGFLLNLAVICNNGRYTIRLLTNNNKPTIPDRYLRHNIFAIVEEFNKCFLVFGLEWKLGAEARWLELSEKRSKSYPATNAYHFHG